MAKSRRKRRRRAPSRKLRLEVMALFLVGFAVGGILLLKWAESPRGKVHLAQRGVQGAHEWLVEHLTASVLRTLHEGGVSQPVIETRGGIITIRVPRPPRLLLLNARVTAAVEHAGGRVHRGRRFPVGDTDGLDLQFGTDDTVTHRLVATPRGADELPALPLPAGRIALVIDDWGHKFDSVAQRILALDAPLTLAVLPERRYSRRILTEAQRSQKQTILHLPMEPDEERDANAGELAVRVGMAPSAIRELTERALDGLPGVEGLNNHMGSKATRFRGEMRPVMEVLAERGLLFLDSLTSHRSVAFEVAVSYGVPSARNNAFLDEGTTDPAVVTERLLRLLDRARETGSAIGIAHVNEATATALEQVLPRLAPGDVEPVFLSDLVFQRVVATGDASR